MAYISIKPNSIESIKDGVSVKFEKQTGLITIKQDEDYIVIGAKEIDWLRDALHDMETFAKMENE